LIVDSLWALHSNEYDYAATRPELTQAEVDEVLKMATATVYETEHPVVRIHPDTKERCIVLGHFVKKFVGMNIADSLRLYAMLQERILLPANCMRWQWKVGDVAIWDNRATQHYAVDDYDERRIMRRVTLSGDVPISITGEHSRQIQPPIASA
jgi:taurine dioxygenase